MAYFITWSFFNAVVTTSPSMGSGEIPQFGESSTSKPSDNDIMFCERDWGLLVLHVVPESEFTNEK